VRHYSAVAALFVMLAAGCGQSDLACDSREAAVLDYGSDSRPAHSAADALALLIDSDRLIGRMHLQDEDLRKDRAIWTFSRGPSGPASVSVKAERTTNGWAVVGYEECVGIDQER